MTETRMEYGARPELPLLLKIVAILVILEGVTAVIEVLMSLAQGTLNLNLGVLYIPAGIGLLRLSQGWRTFVLFTLWLGFILIPVVWVVAMASGIPRGMAVYGMSLGAAATAVITVACVLGFGMCLFQYWVLTRRDVRALFGLPPR